MLLKWTSFMKILSFVNIKIHNKRDLANRAVDFRLSEKFLYYQGQMTNPIRGTMAFLFYSSLFPP
jgi:hypothetical protein